MEGGGWCWNASWGIVGGGVDWVYQAQDGGQWQDLVGTVMSLRILWRSGNSLTT